MNKMYTIRCGSASYSIQMEDVTEVRVIAHPPNGDYRGNVNLYFHYRNKEGSSLGSAETVNSIIDFLLLLFEDRIISKQGLQIHLQILRDYFEVTAKDKAREIEKIERKELDTIDDLIQPPDDISELIDEVLALKDLSE